MDGSLTVVRADSGDVVASTKAHTKYLVRALWGGAQPSAGCEGAPNSVASNPSLPPEEEGSSPLIIYTASQDQNVGVYHLSEDRGALVEYKQARDSVQGYI